MIEPNYIKKKFDDTRYIIMPEKRRIGSNLRLNIENAIFDIEQAIGQEVHSIFLQPHNENPKEYHAIKFILKREI